MTATEKDRDILARTLWGEARGESLAGQIVTLDTGKNKWTCDPLAGAAETLGADGNGESH